MILEFDKKVDRQGLATVREEATPENVAKAGLISLWGAEFEFKMPSFISEAIKDWADRGLVAYSYADDAYMSLVRNWMKLHRNWEICEEWIVPTYGHTHSVGTMCRAFTNPGDGIIGLAPTYHTTWKPVNLNGRVHVDCPLLFDGTTYSIDYDALEQLMAVPNNKMLAFCNPHNPIGKVWGKEDLIRIASLAFQYDVIIYSDEIFGDTVYEGIEMLTFPQVTDIPLKWIIGTSIGKTFSITGVPQANMIIADEALRESFLKQRDIDHYGSFNPMLRAAYFAGYTLEGSQWVKGMMNYCYENYLFIEQFVRKNIPQMKVIKPDGTYILWIDCRGLQLGSDNEYQSFFNRADFFCDAGTTYGSEPGFIRINLAVPRKELEKVFYTLQKSIK